ncbi:MAG TPA: UDP-2,3-diacylglucosamine diphosphatase [Woeseiaceae bacterium]|nr:UDP-2,3-diacylglucosamine diphosphatase [Woeseiaceae bacterium]
MTTLFISDLHLEADRPEIGEQFLSFLDAEAAAADALYILGDLFEYWIGDDDPDPYYADMKEALSTVTGRGVPVYFMHGNRDFLIGERFAADTGVQLLGDPSPVNLYGKPVLLSHGDALCTDDLKYQEVRKVTRDPAWQARMLGKSVPERRAIAEQARADSMAHGGSIDLAISDVNQTAVETLLRRHDLLTLLHGQTHRPAIHEFPLDGRPAMRIVLGDWYEQGSVLRWDEDGPVLGVLERSP